MSPKVSGTHKSSSVNNSEAERRREWIREVAREARKKGVDVPPEVVIMTMLVESNMKNLDHGDRDSVGLFQQRANWGSVADRMTPSKALEKFLNGVPEKGIRGAVDYKDDYGGKGPGAYGAWAQAVQVSAFPDRYQERLGDAVELLKDAGVQPSPGAENFHGTIVGAGDGSSVVHGSGGGGTHGSGGSTSDAASDFADAGSDNSAYYILRSLLTQNEVQDFAALLGISLDALKAMTPAQLKQAIQTAANEGKITKEQASQMTQAIASGDHFQVPSASATPVSMESSPLTSAAPASPAAVPGVAMVPAAAASSSAGIPIHV